LILLTLASSQIYAFGLPGLAKSQILRTLASSQVYGFLHWQVPKSILLFASASKIMDFAYLGKLTNLCF
jgi:hypothetical protein